MRRGLLCLLLIAIAGCKPPRSPREGTLTNLTGSWSGETGAIGVAADTGTIQWRMRLEESRGGGISGRGAAGGPGSAEFPLDGIRGEKSLTLRLRMNGEPVHYRGSLIDSRTIGGQVQLPRDTLTLVLKRD